MVTANVDLVALGTVADGLDEDNFATDAKLVRAAVKELERLRSERLAAREHIRELRGEILALAEEDCLTRFDLRSVVSVSIERMPDLADRP